MMGPQKLIQSRQKLTKIGLQSDRNQIKGYLAAIKGSVSVDKQNRAVNKTQSLTNCCMLKCKSEEYGSVLQATKTISSNQQRLSINKLRLNAEQDDVNQSATKSYCAISPIQRKQTKLLGMSKSLNTSPIKKEEM